MLGFFRRKKRLFEGRDFSGIDSREKAEELWRHGDLEKLYLLPPQFGGDEDPRNFVYVPVGLAGAKQGIDDNVISPLVKEGRVTKYRATPEYSGKSFIPIAIRIVAYDPGQFESLIKIWGEGLKLE